MSGHVFNPEAIGDPNQTPRVQLFGIDKWNAELPQRWRETLARAEQAENAIQRVQSYVALLESELADDQSDDPFTRGRFAAQREVVGRLLAALDSTDPPLDAQRPEERSDEGPKNGHDIATGRPCDIYVPPEYCSEPTRCRVHRRSDAGLPAGGEKRK